MKHTGEQERIKELFAAVKEGSLSIDEAVLSLKMEPFSDLDFAKIDHHRALRQGVPEVIYGGGKTPEQILKITESMLEHGCRSILITRMDTAAADYLSQHVGLSYHAVCRVGIVGMEQDIPKVGSIVVASGGTSDIPVCEEAALTAEVLGNQVHRLYDVGVAGIHRLLSNSRILMTARVIIAVAGMEGALASVIGGLADCPVIAVPTSVGYGANFGGLSALLGMLNSCASGISVVNIDNGFGAGYLASMINQMKGIEDGEVQL